jgi:hypothetical protein
MARWISAEPPVLAAGAGAVVREVGAPRAPPPVWLLATLYYGSVLALAFVEEALWDRWIWHDRAWLFGDVGVARAERHPVVTSLLVALLSLPQVTHYVLDRYIWRVGPHNPALARQLGFAPSEGGPTVGEAPRSEARGIPAVPS